MPARPTNRLSARQVKTLGPGLHADGAGLYLRVDASGARRWMFIFQWRKQRKEMGIGSASVLGLADARAAAGAAKLQVAKGVNPISARKAQRSADNTFGAVAESYLDDQRPGWTNGKHVYQWETSLRVHARPLRDIPAGEVTTDDVLDALRPVWSRIPDTAKRTRGRIETVLDSAKARGLIDDPRWVNPARWKGHLAHLLPVVKKATKHHPALPFVDTPAFLVALRERAATTARALEFLILTAARTGEVIGARGREFDLDAKIWTVPAERMKRRVEHQVPLSDAAIAVLIKQAYPSNQLAADAFVFPGLKRGKPLSNMAMEMLLRRMRGEGKKGPEGLTATVHGFRSTFRDWAGETTNFARDVVEMALSHAVGDEVERAYRRGTALAKRRKLLDAWAGFCSRKVGANVTPIGARKAS